MKLPVLIYYKLHPEQMDDDTVSIFNFYRQLTLLRKNGYTPITCKELYDYLMMLRSLPEKPILISFDKGHISQFRHARPILLELGFRAVFFVTAEWVLQSSCNQQINTPQDMDVVQLQILQEEGFEIGIHGDNYIDYKRSSFVDVLSDLRNGIAMFKKLGLTIINALAYPYGANHYFFWKGSKIDTVLKQQKILLAFSKGNKVNDLKFANRYNIRRIEVSGTDTDEKFLKKISGRRLIRFT